MRRGGRHGKGAANNNNKSGSTHQGEKKAASNGSAHGGNSAKTAAAGNSKGAGTYPGVVIGPQFCAPSPFAQPSHFVQNLDEMLCKIEQLHAPIAQAHLHFELMLFLYLFLHTIIQNFNIYRTNFYNYNFYLLFLSVIVLLKRVVLEYWKQIRWKNSSSRLSSPQIYINLIIIAVIVSNSLYLLFQLFLRHPFKNFLFLVYPFVLYATCYGLAWRGKKKKKREGKSRPNSYYGRNAEETTEWFVDRLKGVAYSSLECGYFAGFLPLKFLQHDYLYFDSVRCAIIVLYITLNSFVMLFAHLLCTSFHELYLHSQLLGCWRVCIMPRRRASPISDESEEEPESNGHDAKSDSDESSAGGKQSPTRREGATGGSAITATTTALLSKSDEGDGSRSDDDKIHAWSRESGPYKRGIVVRHRGKHYVAIAALNSAEPGLYLPWLIYVLFGRPERVHTILILAQSVVVVSQLCLLLNSSAWGTYAVMLMCSYGVLCYCIVARRTNLPLAAGLQPDEWLPCPATVEAARGRGLPNNSGSGSSSASSKAASAQKLKQQ